MRVAVLGLWHLGCVTAACLAEAGFSVVGLDPDDRTVADLRQGRPPLHEPGLDQLTATGLAAGNLSFTTDPESALAAADVLWVTFDTPVNDRDEADVAFVRSRLESVAPHLRPGTLVLISSQVPVGFTRSLELDWRGRGLRFAVSPENLRLGKALEVFRRPERVVIGVRSEDDRALLGELFGPFCSRIEWMSVESAEMTKHALNAFLAASVTFINELARVCEAVGADAREVERGLKSEARIGPKAYLSPGSGFAGGTLARDIGFLIDLGRQHGVDTPLFEGVRAGNDLHKGWLRGWVVRLITGVESPVVAVLGLTYKPGTSTLRRSSAVELCRWLAGRGVRVKTFDPAVPESTAELQGVAEVCSDAAGALRNADVAVVATEWPHFRALSADQFAGLMRAPCVIDPNHFLAATLGSDPRLLYAATGRPAPPRGANATPLARSQHERRTAA
jgi:UDPglucose 6-dehydrogenase